MKENAEDWGESCLCIGPRVPRRPCDIPAIVLGYTIIGYSERGEKKCGFRQSMLSSTQKSKLHIVVANDKS